MIKLYRYIGVALIAGIILDPVPVWAVQTHGGAEGLVSHQIGHILFVLGMVYLLFRIYAMKITGRGWMEFKFFLWLVLLWNVITFTGHWLDEYVLKDNFARFNGVVVSFHIDSFADGLYYLSRLDHLVLVPAFFCLLVSLHKWGAAK